MCDFPSHAHSHTPPAPVHTHRSERSASRQHVIQLCHVILCIYTLNSASAAHTHALSTWDILCSSCALLQQCTCVCGWRLQPRPPPAPVLWHSVGAGCDGFLQLQVQGSRAELEAAVAGLADAAGLEQLLAWHWDLLVAAAGTEHVTAVPAERHRQVTAGLSHRAPSLHTIQPHYICSRALFFMHGNYVRYLDLIVGFLKYSRLT